MRFKRVFLILFILTFTICSIDNPHFFRGSYFFGEPRIAKDNLFTSQIRFSGGGTFDGINRECKTNILQIYGRENIFELANGAPESVLDKNPGSFLDTLWQKTPANKNFGQMDFFGHFQTIELDFDIQQNFKYGIFTELYVPIRELQTHNISFKDFSTKENAGPDINFAQWQNFVRYFDSYLNRYGLCLHSSKVTSLADMTTLIGWTLNYEDTKYIDYIDASIKLGVVFPFGKKKVDNVFAISPGYGHWGFPVYVDLSVGLYEWLTLGGHLSGIVFGSDRENLYMKTANSQNGLIKITKGAATVDFGSILTFGLFLRGDHVNRRFSFLLAYRYDQQFATKLRPFDLSTFRSAIVNNDSTLKGWVMHTIDFSMEYDFATYLCPNRPRLELFFDIPVAGKRIFKTTMIGLGVSFDY